MAVKQELSQLTKDRLRELAGVLVANYRLFNMDYWARTNCKTTGCIAGIAVIHFAPDEWGTYEEGLRYLVSKDPQSDGINGHFAHTRQVRPEAEKLLGITDSQGTDIFLERYWPDRFRKRFQAATTQRGRAKIAAEYLIAIVDGKVDFNDYYNNRRAGIGESAQ